MNHDERIQIAPEGTSALNSSSKKLSPKQEQVLVSIAKGLSRKETAALLGLSISTVNTHCECIFQKLSLKKATDIARYAVRHGFLS